MTSGNTLPIKCIPGYCEEGHPARNSENIVQEAHKKDVMSHSSVSSCQVNRISQRPMRGIKKSWVFATTMPNKRLMHEDVLEPTKLRQFLQR